MGSERLHGDPTVTLQQYRVRKFYRDMGLIFQKYGCDGVIDAGDTTDDREEIPIPTLHDVANGSSQFKATRSNNFKIIGNHEQYLKNTEVHVGRLFSPYFKVIRATKVIPTEGATLVFCSFPADHSEAEHWLQETAENIRGKKILIGHFSVIGGLMNSGEIKTGIHKDTLALYDLVLLGHIHRPQALLPNAFYIGSPFQQNYGERDEAKRVGIIDTVACKVKWIRLNGYPRYRIISLSEFQEMEQGEDRITVNLTSEEEVEAFYKLPQSIRATPNRQYEAEVVDREAEIRKRASLRETLENYVKIVNPKSKGIETEIDALVEIGEQLVS